MATNKMTVVRLLAVPLQGNDYKHTMWFSNVEDQTNYYNTKVKFGTTDFAYQRKDGYIRYPKCFDDLTGVNYVMYQNQDHGNKWFYAFITNMEYLNDETTKIYIETDVMQTYMFTEYGAEGYTVLPSFVEREHVDIDEPGMWLVDEGLATGEYKVNMVTKSGYGAGDKYIIVGTTKTPDGTNVKGTMYDGIYSGVRYYGFPHTLAGVGKLETWLNGFDSAAAGEAIQCMFLAPADLVNVTEESNAVVASAYADQYFINVHNDDGTTLAVTTGLVDGKEPRNKKLLAYPYRYLMVSNNNGTDVPMHYEDFAYTDKPTFCIEGCLTPGCSVRMVPWYYKGANRNDAESIPLGKYPTLNWTSDLFTNWVTQNAVNHSVALAGNAVSIASGVMTLSGEAIASGAMGIASMIGEREKMALTPPQSKGNINSGDVVTAADYNDFIFYDMTIKAEYREILDGYFDMFGYKINRVKVPNTNHRYNWWYTKTIDVNITGNIPMDDLQKIKDVYNNGVTFWKNIIYVGDYSQENAIRPK